MSSNQNKSVTEQMQQTAQNTWDATKNTASSATESVQGMFTSGQKSASDAVDKAGRAMKPESQKSTTEKVQDSAKDTWDSAKGTADQAARKMKPESEKTLGDKAKDTWDTTKEKAGQAKTS